MLKSIKHQGPTEKSLVTEGRLHGEFTLIMISRPNLIRLQQPWAIRQCRVSGHKNMVLALFPSIWAGAENIKMCRPPMCGGLTWALCIFHRQRLGLGEFCLIADCHRKLTWGSRHEFHIIFLASSNSGASKNSFSTKVGRFPNI